MPDYSKGKIYRIYCNVSKKNYVGSTCNTLIQRLSSHKSDFKRYLEGKRDFTTSFDIIEKNDFNIFLIKDTPCNNKQELLKFERFYIENTENCVNKKIPTRTIKEYNHLNREKLKEKYEKNKEKYNLQKNQRYQENKEKFCEIQKQYYERKKNEISVKYKEYWVKYKDEINRKRREYCEKNKDETNRKRREYWAKNKDEINRKRREKRKEKII